MTIGKTAGLMQINFHMSALGEAVALLSIGS